LVCTALAVDATVAPDTGVMPLPRAVQLFHHRADAQPAARGVARAAAWLSVHEARDTESRT